ncbi:MAG TPA: hypothetical protein VD972_21270, partial [Hyalangium sp.]|nr:hypothetical protein [Hyalangium sp.]
MNRGNLWRASLMMIALTAIACGQDLESTPEAGQPSTLATRQDAAFSQFKALILDRTVVGGTDSVEAAAARRLGLGVTVATDAQWAAMTAADFATYRVIILGDAHCASLDVASAALANRHVWGPVINGNMLVAGTAPVANGAPALVTEKAIRFASAESGLTGLYMSLSCYYENAAPNTHVELLEPFGTFSVQGGGCHNTTHIVSAHPALNALSDHTMSNWSCSVNAQFDSFPLANFAPWSIALYPEESRSSNPTREFV